ncbi:probable serine/threonine-protein kinase ndrD [Microplitis mediator]|uniref:probable serine/threonine-protein kinase ndrD n=1 Tax=Microplitis mediator TaxID=375433 RepID=UPI002556C544|nr:probable serine/threonine-protein kinase ndrD [Microplitis mediator]
MFEQNNLIDSNNNNNLDNDLDKNSTNADKKNPVHDDKKSILNTRNNFSDYESKIDVASANNNQSCDEDEKLCSMKMAISLGETHALVHTLENSSISLATQSGSFAVIENIEKNNTDYSINNENKSTDKNNLNDENVEFCLTNKKLIDTAIFPDQTSTLKETLENPSISSIVPIKFSASIEITKKISDDYTTDNENTNIDTHNSNSKNEKICLPNEKLMEMAASFGQTPALVHTSENPSISSIVPIESSASIEITTKISDDYTIDNKNTNIDTHNSNSKNENVCLPNEKLMDMAASFGQTPALVHTSENPSISSIVPIESSTSIEITTKISDDYTIDNENKNIDTHNSNSKNEKICLPNKNLMEMTISLGQTPALVHISHDSSNSLTTVIESSSLIKNTDYTIDNVNERTDKNNINEKDSEFGLTNENLIETATASDPTPTLVHISQDSSNGLTTVIESSALIKNTDYTIDNENERTDKSNINEKDSEFCLTNENLIETATALDQTSTLLHISQNPFVNVKMPVESSDSIEITQKINKDYTIDNKNEISDKHDSNCKNGEICLANEKLIEMAIPLDQTSILAHTLQTPSKNLTNSTESTAFFKIIGEGNQDYPINNEDKNAYKLKQSIDTHDIKIHNFEESVLVQCKPTNLSTEISDFPNNVILVEKSDIAANTVDHDISIDSEAFGNEQRETNNFDDVFNAECAADIRNNQSLFSHVTITQEDNLIELAILPTDSIEIQNLYADESDLFIYDTNTEISDRLEHILSAQLESRTIEIVRDDSGITDGLDLSTFPQVTCKNKPFILDTSALTSSSCDFREADDLKDETFDPSKIQHSSTLLQDETEEFVSDSSTNCIHTVSNVQENYQIIDSTSENNKTENENKDVENKRCNENLQDTSDTPTFVNSLSALRKIPFARVGSCDNSEIEVLPNTTPRWQKKYACMYCHKKVVKLPRHLETVHKVFEDVKKLKDIGKGTKERKDVLKIFRNNGSFMHNTNKIYNDGTLLVPRRPNTIRKATEYTTCPNCLLTVTISNSRKHISKCIDPKIKGSRTYKILGTTVEGRLHSTASDTLRLVIFPVLKEDEIVRLIRYDWLIILYGNKLCLKYGPNHFQHNMVRARLRLMGRFLQAAKQLNSNITELAQLFNPKFVDLVVDAIALVARINRIKNSCEAPAVAENLVTYIKQIGLLLEAEYVKRQDEESLKQVINFSKVYKTEAPDSINKIAMEAQAKFKRQKVVVLPMTDDIKKLVSYLRKERNRCFGILKEKFVFSEWLNGLKLVAVYLLVFNRRRVGDIQNILTSDLDKLESIDAGADKEEFNKLDDVGKKIATKFYRFEVRGKLNRIVAVIAKADLIEELKLLRAYRSQAKVPVHNEFLFGLPNPITDRIRVLNLCKEMRIISELCGAEKPQLLRGTGLRKHVATKCVELDLTETALSDVIGHLGHSDKIHREIYRQPLKSKTIVQVTKVLEAARGNDDDVGADDDDEDDQSEYSEIPISAESDINEINNQSLCETKNVESSFSESVPSTSSDITYGKPCENLSSSPATNKPIKRYLWSATEKNIICSEFKKYLESRTLPSFAVIDELKKRYPCLENRSRQSIKTWVSNQFKVPSKSSTKLRVISNQAVNIDLAKFKNTKSQDIP